MKSSHKKIADSPLKRRRWEVSMQRLQGFCGKQGLSCDRCKCRMHQGCTKLTEAHYEFLKMHPHVDSQWLCQPCKKNKSAR